MEWSADLSPYSFVADNPVLYADPLGLDSLAPDGHTKDGQTIYTDPNAAVTNVTVTGTRTSSNNKTTTGTAPTTVSPSANPVQQNTPSKTTTPEPKNTPPRTYTPDPETPQGVEPIPLIPIPILIAILAFWPEPLAEEPQDMLKRPSEYVPPQEEWQYTLRADEDGWYPNIEYGGAKDFYKNGLFNDKIY